MAAQIFVAVLRLELHLRRGDVDASAWRLDRCPHTRALAAIGGVPSLIVPDNAKVAAIKACLCGPQINRTHAEMAAHYGTAMLPRGRVGRPHIGTTR